MQHQRPRQTSETGSVLSRGSALRHAAVVTSLALASGSGHVLAAARTAGTHSAGVDPSPLPAIAGILAALKRFPLVALGEHHGMQEMLDVLTTLLLHPSLPDTISDIVVEFGNARYQDLADQFILGDQPVATGTLQRIWRDTVGGDTVWDAPVYAQFFHTVRAVNWMRPPARRVRVLLGDPPFDGSKVRGAADAAYVRAVAAQRDAHYATVVEREVLAKGGRALLIAGYPHLRRGIYADPGHLSATTLLARRHGAALFVIDPLPLNPGWAPDALIARVESACARWPRPALAHLAGTWLGAQPMPFRAVDAAAATYSEQADAILYLGPRGRLTASRADPAIYQWGPYPAALRRLSQAEARIAGRPVDLVADGFQRAEGGATWP
jgi:hypothetical protein